MIAAGPEICDRISDAEVFEVSLAFRRDEFAAEFCTWEFFLFDEQHAKTVAREMNRRARSRRPSAGDDHVEVSSVVLHCARRGWTPLGVRRPDAALRSSTPDQLQSGVRPPHSGRRAIHHAACARGAQHEPIRKSALHRNIPQPGALGQLQQLITFETPQYRQRTIMSQQSIVQNQLPQRRVKKIRDRMTMKIDHKYPSLRHATHLTKNLDHLLVEKVMREERTDHIIKLRIRQTEASEHRHAPN